MAQDDIRVTSPAKLHNRPAGLGDVRRAFRRGYVLHPIPVARRNNTKSKYIPIAEIDNDTRGAYIDVHDPWSLVLHTGILNALMAEGVEVRYAPAVYPQGDSTGIIYVWARLSFAPDINHANSSWLGAGCGPDPLSALLRAISCLPERSKLKAERNEGHG